MIVQVALIISVVLQFGAFFITISLIPKTKFNIAWISISIGFLLMALRRLIDLFFIFNAETSTTQTYFSSWVAIVISVAMLIASFYIRKIFDLLNRLDKIRKENEARVLTAIISTEEKERKYFATELHDGLGPILSSIKMTLSAINKSNMGATNKEILTKTEFAVDNAITTTKEISNHLNPQVLERFGLEKAIKTFAKHTLSSRNFVLTVNSNLGKTRCSYNLEVIIYRISCELINNTLKHASATQVNISIHNYPKKIEFKYDDNGIGLDITNKNDTGMGLTNIQSRVKSLNGSIKIDSKPRKGISVNIDLPK